MNLTVDRPENCVQDRSEQRRPWLSVIIPAYNAADTLAAQLDALKAQTYSGDWEIVVVDNGSTDGTAALVREYQRSMPHLRLVHAPEVRGRAYACNVGAQAARGDALAFCDADDVADPGWLSALAEALEEHEVVAGAIEVHKLNQSAPWRPAPFVSATEPVLDFLPYASGTSFALSREAFEAVNGFSVGIPPCEDIDISWRLQLAGYTLHDAPSAVMHCRYRSSLRGLWKQTVTYAEAHVFLYKRFRAYGMPRSSIRQALRRYGWLLRRLPRLHRVSRRGRIKWLRTLALCWGRLRGSLRYRTLYL